MKRSVKSGLCAILAVTSSGCAAITAGSTDELKVNSTPPGAQVRVDGVPTATTPATIRVSRKRPPTVDVAAPGYASQQCPVQMSAGGGYIAADIAWCVVAFPLGCISFIDAGGSWNELEQGSCDVALQPASALAPPNVPSPTPGMGGP